MAGCKSNVRAIQRRPVSVPTCMQEGEKFIRWDEDSLTGTAVTMRVDPHGYFVHIVDQNKEVELLDILTIRDTRTGCYAKTPKDQKLRDMVTMGGGASSLEDKTVTLCYGSDFVNVNFINFCCNKQETAKLWSDELLKMAYNLLSIHSCVTSVLQKTHTRICLDVDKMGKIPVKNVIKTFASHKDDKKRVEKALEACGLPSTKAHVIEPERFSFKHFLSFYTHLTGRQEIEKIFDELCGSDDAKKKGYLTVQQLVFFLNQMQRDPRLNEILYPYADAQKAREIIAQYEPNKANINKGMLSSEGFMQYLMSDDNGIVPLDKLDLSDDMEQPLSHYFINSSHNTYLTGHQFTGKSSVEIYRQCLLSGCRCVELDFWNGRTEEPVICHGFTLVPEILAKDVISAIAESAFKTSEWPVILSFENHCNQKQQAKIAQYCQEMFGDMLLESPLPNFPLEANQSLPPPAALRRKILIKNKKKHHHKHHHKTPVTRQPTFTVPVQPELSVSGEAAAADPPAAAGDSDEEDSSSEEEDSTACDLTPEELERLRARADKERGTAGRESQAGEEISALVNYVQPGHFHSFQEAERRNRSYEMSSFVETQATTLLKAFPVEFVNYNKRQLSRVYPKGTRVDSHNFMPQVFWNAGCQLVALNYQTLDLAMQLNVGIFEYNGRSGYLLKPDFMRRPDRRFDPFAESTVDGIIAGTVSVKVISGQFLSEKRVGVWVEVDMYGLPADTVRRKFKTRVIQNNAINPVWDEEPFLFKKVVLPYLACVRITAYEESGRMLGHRVLPVVGLRPGYRHVSLRNEFGQVQGHGTLFIKVTVGDYVPFGLSDFAEALVNPIKYQSELEKRAQQLRVLTDDETDDTEGVDAESVVAAAAAAVDSNSALGHVTSSTSTPRRDLTSTSSVDLQRPRVASSGLPTAPMAGGFPSPATRRAANSYSTGAAGGACVTAASELSANGDVSVHSTTLETPSHKRTDTLRNSSATASSSEDINIPSELSVADSVEMLWEDRQVRDRRQELERKLETLQKKFNKDRTRLQETGCSTSLSGERRSTLSKTHHRLVKTFSHKAMENAETTVVPCAEAMELLYSQWAAAERELKEKYIDMIHDTLDKTVRSSQALQLKKLQLFHDRKVAESKKKIENDLKESSKKLVKKNLTKDEMSRLRREMSQVIVKDGVEHREKLTGRYNQALESLMQQHLQVRQLCSERRESARHRLSTEESARVSELLKNTV